MPSQHGPLIHMSFQPGMSSWEHKEAKQIYQDDREDRRMANIRNIQTEHPY